MRVRSGSNQGKLTTKKIQVWTQQQQQCIRQKNISVTNRTRPVLYVRIYGEQKIVYQPWQGERRRYYCERQTQAWLHFLDWNSIEKIYYPSQVKEDEKDMDRKMNLKYQKLARLATHTNDWLRKIAAADLEKSLYENRITTGTAIDGKCIRLSTIEKYCGSWNMQRFRQALRNKEKFSTFRFDFCGYDGTLWCEPRENGDMAAGFSKEYRNCGNGDYYL